ncbi:MAG TPA: M15 family metallopeptidase [Bdellovibrionales bacterium]|nr:M15 family metallopeptidase [Bdellovibrionales bacterium]
MHAHLPIHQRSFHLAKMVITLALIFGFAAELAGAGPSPKTSLVEQIRSDGNYRSLTEIDNVKIDLRYATTNNFMGENLYGEFNEAFLHKTAFEKLKMAAARLANEKPGYKLLVYDALRPRSVQKRLFAKVKGTDKEEYVADPAKGSIHNFGFAVDLSLADETGAELDMGTPYDDFTNLAQPQKEDQFLKAGKLTAKQLENRKLLRKIMTGAGFLQLQNEWWHYDSLPATEVRDTQKIVE